MRRKMFAVLAAALLGAPAIGPAPAQADVSLTSVTLSSVTLSSSSTVFKGDAGCGDRIRLTIAVYHPAADLSDIFDVSADPFGPDGDSADVVVPTFTSRSGSYLYYTDWINLCGWNPAGRYRLHTEVVWWDDASSSSRKAVSDTYFYVKRPTALSYHAAPEPAQAGGYLTHSGRLLFAPLAGGAAYGPAGVSLPISFQPEGTANYVAKGSVTTRAGGYYSVRLPATDSGTWRIVYAGNSVRQAHVQVDHVDTR